MFAPTEQIFRNRQPVEDRTSLAEESEFEEILLSPTEALIKDAIVQIIVEADRQIEEKIRVGNLPAPSSVELKGLKIEVGMDSLTRRELANRNSDIVAVALTDSALFEIGIEPSLEGQKIIDWSGMEAPLRTVFTRLKPHLALFEDYLIDENMDPLSINPRLVISRDLIKYFLSINSEVSD